MGLLSVFVLLFSMLAVRAGFDHEGYVKPHDIPASIEEGRRWIVGVRQKLHQKPELGFKEIETSAALRFHMDQMGIPYKCAPVGASAVRQTLAERPTVPAARFAIDYLEEMQCVDIGTRSRRLGFRPLSVRASPSWLFGQTWTLCPSKSPGVSGSPAEYANFPMIFKRYEYFLQICAGH